ncbi:uncharacterized protein KQ657_004141 [Scheffersomyces spartinae]|uniref:Ubiquitin carboxyl-terminal hydrolase n=1 Tax=Scheffersomyces spartinae TaxID=45513 RepID=A0A9P8AJ28_9ASCO|nr:uncharacterized protein KQ657_004141 [Scheffersomyces spartinae]KAG7195028.1 hypothetical protein KQ657_004141 [Scheffersomyces spartinae]
MAAILGYGGKSVPRGFKNDHPSPSGVLNARNKIVPKAENDNNKNREILMEVETFSFYGDLGICKHIKSVLETKARDTVFLTYKQAVKISQMKKSEDVINIYKSDGSVIPNSKLVELKTNALKCTDCSMCNMNTCMICLQCPHVGCLSLNHAKLHYQKINHLFAIDSSNGLLFCFQCGDYVNHSELETIRRNELYRLAGKIDSDDDDNDNEEGEENEDSIEDVASHYKPPLAVAVNGLRGFINLGSTCFMSAILQTLVHNPIIKYQFFNNDVHFLNCESNLLYSEGVGSLNESNSCITCSIDHIFKEFYTSTEHGGFGMTNLLATAWYKKKSLAGFQEQDAHEFWQFLLNEFHSDYERVTGQNHSGEDCKCITHTTFHGELQSSIRCTSCDSVTTTIDPMIDVSLEIKKSKNSKDTISLYDCLDLFTQEERLDTMYTCKHCGEKTNAYKSLKVNKTPPVFSIQLKRFEHILHNDTSNKLDIPVKVPLYLNLTKYIVGNNQQNEIGEKYIYELFALVTHIGSVNTGHYIVLIKQGDGQWLKFDDSVITLVSQKEVDNTPAYLLYYITHRI